MNVTTTQCCAAMEMYGMGTLDDPKAHLLSVCQQIYPDQSRYGMADLQGQPHAHYVFHGVVKYKDGTKPDYRYSATAPTNLARYIRLNKLGKVRGSAAEWNRRNHPDHLVRVWVWTPDPENLKKWFAKNRTKAMCPKPYLKQHPTIIGVYDLVEPILYGEEGYKSNPGAVRVLKEKATQDDLMKLLATWGT